MKKKREAELLQQLQSSIDQTLDVVYALVGHNEIPDADVKAYLDPFFQTTTALRFYAKTRLKNLGGEA